MSKKNCILKKCLLCFILTICSNNLISQKCISPNPIGETNFVLQNADSRLEIKNAKLFWIDSAAHCLKVQEVGLDSITFNNFCEGLISNDPRNGKFLAVLYVDSAMDKLPVVSRERIKAVAIYYKKKKHYYFKLFVKNTSGYSELKPLSGKTYLVTSASLNGIAENIVFKNRQGYSLVYIDKFPPYDNYSVAGPELLFRRIGQYINEKEQ